MSRVRRVLFLRYAVAVVAPASALLLAWLAHPLTDGAGLLMFVSAVLCGAWFGGLGPGIVATLLSLLALGASAWPNSGLDVTNGQMDAADVGIFSITAIAAISAGYRGQRYKEALAKALAEEAALRRSEAMVRGMFETVVDAVITIDQRGIVGSFNPAAERMFGYSAAEVVGRNVVMLMPTPYSRDHEDYLRRYLETGQAKVIGIGREAAGKRKDGSVFPIDLSVGEQRVGTDRLFTGIIRDITERKRLENEILEISGREQERIGRDLHDGVGQLLTGVAFLSKALAQRLQHKSWLEAADAEKIADLVNQAISQTRQLSRGLHPVELSHGLLPALEELAAGVQRTFDVACVVRADPDPPIAGIATATHLYRIAQEAINNAVRHGKSRHIEVNLRCTEESLRLSVRDDGKGFTPGHTPGLGLRTMGYRSRVIGAALDIRTSPDGGTIVTCTMAAPAALPATPLPPAGPVKSGET
jgi:two-component system, LuxR family, sensor kinase FixL